MSVSEFATKPALIRAVERSGALLRGGPFRLKSGRTADYYFDLRRLTLSGHVRTVAASVIAALPAVEYDAVGGPSVGADPIVGALLSHFAEDTRGFLVRPASKDHGADGLVIGSVRPGDRCVVIEDVTTSGGSLLHAIDAVRDFGCTVMAAMTVLDRTGAVRPKLEAMGIPFVALLTPRDFGIEEGP